MNKLLLFSKRTLPWYLKGGVPKSACLAAYQAIGAASLADSYINRANPGTYNITTTSAPSFEPAIGWTFNGTTNFLKTGIIPAVGATQTWSMICRFSGVTGDTGYMIGSGNSTTAHYFMFSGRRTAVRRYWNGNSNIRSAYSNAGVMAIAGGNCYLDGVADGTLTPTSITGYNICIGAMYTPELQWAGEVQAAAIYNVVLSAAQVLAISNAMAALPDPFDITVPAFPGPPVPSVSTGEFTIAFISDAHTNMFVTEDDLSSMMNYLKNHAERLNLQAVLYGGDITCDFQVNRELFARYMDIIADIPHLLAIGNHDYGVSVERDSTIFNSLFGPSYYTSKSWWSGGFQDLSCSENAYLLLTIGSVDYILITMEFFPRDVIITWLNALLTTYSTRKAIIVTHAYEYSDGSPFTVGDTWGPTTYPEIVGTDYHWGTDIWTELLKLHDNIILIHSGHVNLAARHSTNSDGGQPVHQFLFNRQGTMGEPSHIRFMIFNPTEETIKVECYSPPMNHKVEDGSNKFIVSY